MLKVGTFKISYVFTSILILILSLFSNVTFLAINFISLKMLKRGSGFSSYETELRKTNLTLRVINSEIFIEILLSSY